MMFSPAFPPSGRAGGREGPVRRRKNPATHTRTGRKMKGASPGRGPRRGASGERLCMDGEKRTFFRVAAALKKKTFFYGPSLDFFRRTRILTSCKGIRFFFSPEAHPRNLFENTPMIHAHKSELLRHTFMPRLFSGDRSAASFFPAFPSSPSVHFAIHAIHTSDKLRKG